MSSITKHSFHVVGFIKRRPSLSEEEFSRHWFEKHGPLVAPLLVRYGVLNYKQVHTATDIRAQWSNFFGPNSMATLDFDGCAQMEVEDLDRFKAMFEDPYYKDVVAPDEDRFIDKSQWSAAPSSTLGISKPVIEGGKIIDGVAKP